MPGSQVTDQTKIDDAITIFVAAARFTMENPGSMEDLVDTQTLPMKKGRTYKEPWFGSLTAASLTDGQEFNSPSPITDYSLSITPSEVGVQVVWTYRMADSIAENFPRVAGQLMGNAIAYRKDTDLLGLLDSFAGTLGGGTAPFTGGITSAAATMVRAGLPLGAAVARGGARTTGDRPSGTVATVVHEFNRHDIFGQLTGLGGTSQLTGAVVANYPANGGMSDVSTEVLRNGFSRELADTRVVFTGNLPITSNQVKGGVFAKDAIINLRYRSMIDKRVETDDGRAMKHTMVVDYGFGIRLPVGGVELWLDATAPAT